MLEQIILMHLTETRLFVEQHLDDFLCYLQVKMMADKVIEMLLYKTSTLR